MHGCGDMGRVGGNDQEVDLRRFKQEICKDLEASRMMSRGEALHEICDSAPSEELLIHSEEPGRDRNSNAPPLGTAAGGATVADRKHRDDTHPATATPDKRRF
ncbi:hypothetical protein ACLOJK_029460 [Asimina triloba]